MSWIELRFVRRQCRIIRLVEVFAVTQLLIAGFSACAYANGGSLGIELKFHDHALSATIEKATLPEIVAKIEESQDIWVKGLDRVPPLEYSVEFEDMPLRKGIERILSLANHCLVFDEEGELEGIIFLTSPGTSSKSTVDKKLQPQSTSGWSPSLRSQSRYHPKNR